MNSNELRAEIVRHGETNAMLAKHLGVTDATFSNKLNGKVEFTQSEIGAIKNHYDLSSDRVVEIFFALDMS